MSHPLGVPDEPINPCWFCNAPNDAVMGLGAGGPPVEGDLSVCAYCSMPGIFTGDGFGTRVPTPAEYALVRGDETAQAAIRAVRSHVMFRQGPQ